MANERPVSKLHNALRTAAQVVDAELPLAEVKHSDWAHPMAQDRLSLRTEAFKQILCELLDKDWMINRDEREGPSGD